MIVDLGGTVTMSIDPQTGGFPATAVLRGSITMSEVPETDLLSPLTIRGVTLRNRIVMSPMCQYIAGEGLASDWHLVHLGSRARAVSDSWMVEATAVAPERDGSRRATSASGATSTSSRSARIARFVSSPGAIPGIQLAHAGRKASCQQPWLGGARILTAELGGWPVLAPSPIPFDEESPGPFNSTRRESIGLSPPSRAASAVPWRRDSS